MRLIFCSALLSACLSAATLPTVQLSHLPLAFEPNQGQGDRSAMFFARGPGYTIGLESGGASIAMRSKNGASGFVGIRFEGGARQMRPVAERMAEGKVNYFRGANPSKWHTNIPTYGAVRYPRLYAGIDAVFYGQQGRLEYDFVLQPGAEPSQIRLGLNTPVRPQIDQNGDLVLGAIRQHKPLAYQMDGTSRRPVECRYALMANGKVRFALGSYDRSRTLVIDPVLSYASFLGGSSGDVVTGVRVDAAGNLYVGGSTTSANFPARGAAQAMYAGSKSQLLQMQFGDAFVAKLNPAGTALIYATYLGGTGDDLASALAIDSSGAAYVVGATQSADFPVTSGALQKTYRGFTAADNNGFYNSGDGFVAKLNPNGNGLVYATYLGGSLNDLALGVAVDSNGNAVVVGGTESSDFPTTANALAANFRGNTNGTDVAAGDAFVSVVNPTGSALVFSTYLGGSSTESARGVAVDTQNNIYVAGFTASSNFPVSTGAYQTTFQNSGGSLNGNPIVHAFVTKFSPQGALTYSTLLGGESSDMASALSVDATGVYVTGATNSTQFPTTAGAAQTKYGGRGSAGNLGDSRYGDAFVTKLSPDGAKVIYSTFLGGAGDDAGLGVAVDSAGSAYVTGATLSSNLPVTADALQPTFGGLGGQGLPPNSDQGFPAERVRNSGDAFVAKLSATGQLTYSSYYGGTGDDAGLAIAVDAAGNAYVGGNTVSPDLKASSGVVQASFGGAGSQFPRGDGFVAKISFGGTLPGPAAKVTVLPGFTGTGTAGTVLPAPFTVQVSDAQGVAVPGVAVAFTATGATVNPASATTDAQGKAATTVTLGSTSGAGAVTATVAGLPVATSTLTINSSGPAGPKVTAVVNGASFATTSAGGSWITVFIDQTAPAIVVASQLPLPTTLATYSVLVNGAAIPLDAVVPLSPSGTQINAQLPYEIASGNAQVVVQQNGVPSAPFTFAVQQTAPGIFTFGANRAVAQNVEPDGSATLNTPDNPVHAGDYVIVYLTGQGPVDPPIATGALAGASPLSRPTQPYSATLNGSPIPVAFLGMTPGQIALAQANIQIPRDTAPGEYSLAITVGGVPSNSPKISVTTPR